MKIINGYALVEVLKKENKTKNGLILSEETIVNDEGIVIDVDKSVEHIVSIGDKVKFYPHVNNDVELNGKNYKFLLVYRDDSPRTDIVLNYGK